MASGSQVFAVRGRRVHIPLVRFVPPGAARSTAEVADLANAALLDDVDCAPGQRAEGFRGKYLAESLIENVAEPCVGPVLRIAGKGIAVGLHVEVLPDAAGIEGLKIRLQHLVGGHMRMQPFAHDRFRHG